jgi:hypothetical protein
MKEDTHALKSKLKEEAEGGHPALQNGMSGTRTPMISNDLAARALSSSIE